jgi:penicillin-binding protein 2
MKKQNGKSRIIVLVVFLIGVVALSVIRLIQFQILEGEENLKQANKRIVNQVVQKAPRGEIRDRNNLLLATNKTGFNIVFDKVFMNNENQVDTIKILLQILEQHNIEWVAKNQETTNENQVSEIIDDMQDKKFAINNPYVFAQDIPIEVVGKIEEQAFRLNGVYIEETSIRDYLSGDIAPHIIGNTGFIFKEEYKQLRKENYKLNDIIGKDGIEKTFEKYLRGKDGYKKIIQNTKGEVLKIENDVKPEIGNTVTLTIDKELQQEVQYALENHIKSLAPKNGYEAKSGAVVVLDVKTGDILSAVTYPSYDINSYKSNYKELSQNKDLPLFNRAFNGKYRPGSTYKTSVALAGLCEGVIDRESETFCSGRYTFWGDNKWCPTCLGVHKNINVTNALKVSCNIFFYDLGRRLGIDKINQYSKKLGLGVDTGLEIKSEIGRLASVEYRNSIGETWKLGDIAQASIGQLDNSVTVLQMASQAMTIANKGVRYETHILKSITHNSTKKDIIKTNPIIASRIEGKEKEFEIVKEGMVLTAGTLGGKFRIPNVAIKTGTPQTSNSKRFNSAVIGFAPADNPEIAFAIMIEDGSSSNHLVKPIIDAYNLSKKK